MGRLSRS